MKTSIGGVDVAWGERMPGGTSALEATVHGVRIAVSGLPRSDEELRGWMGQNVGFELPL